MIKIAEMRNNALVPMLFHTVYIGNTIIVKIRNRNRDEGSPSKLKIRYLIFSKTPSHFF